MNEDDWLVSSDPIAMLEYIRHKITERKIRLFACACCRRIWDLLDAEFRRAVEVAECFADGLASREELLQARDAARQIYRTLDSSKQSAASAAISAASIVGPKPSFWDRLLDVIDVAPDVWRGPFELGDPLAPALEAAKSAAEARCNIYDLLVKVDDMGHPTCLEYRVETHFQAELLRHIVGNPFRRYTRPQCLDSRIRRLASNIYYCWGNSISLYDALRDIGCIEFAIHFLQPDHPKGCWALDLILGNE
jgi:hypothetical protein